MSLSDSETSVHGAPVDEPTNSWGLHRISHGPLERGQPFAYRHNGSGRASWVYVIDTGIALKHPEFGGRAKWGGTFLKYVWVEHVCKKLGSLFTDTHATATSRGYQTVATTTATAPVSPWSFPC